MVGKGHSNESVKKWSFFVTIYTLLFALPSAPWGSTLSGYDCIELLSLSLMYVQSERVTRGDKKS